MFESWAINFANKIKNANPEETEPHDVLVFGFTILFNLLFTFFLLLIIGWLLGIPFLTLQVMFSFMLVRLLTGGAHLNQSLACSLTSITLILLFVWLPVTPMLSYIYFVISVLCLLRYAPYYEPDQVKHSEQWEQKKKRIAFLWVVFAILIYHYFSHPGLILGVLLQSLLLTPIGISFIYKVNKILSYNGGDKYEENS